MHTDTPDSPWYVVDGDEKRRGRLNMIAHLLASVPYREIPPPPVKLPPRSPGTGYARTDRRLLREVPDHAATLAKNTPLSSRR
ncbi:hypothetical protein RPX00_37610 [Amycolatopsis sp. WGS_07]